MGNFITTAPDTITYSAKLGDAYVPITTSSTGVEISVGTYCPPPCMTVRKEPKPPEIKKVIFNNPATIIIWDDGSKTVVKLMDGDCWDPEKGFIMAYMKKLLGVEKLRKDIKKWVKPQEKKEEEEALNRISFKVGDGTIELLDSVKDTLAKIFNKTEDK